VDEIKEYFSKYCGNIKIREQQSKQDEDVLVDIDKVYNFFRLLAVCNTVVVEKDDKRKISY
jgi:hypothetical protein